MHFYKKGHVQFGDCILIFFGETAVCQRQKELSVQRNRYWGQEMTLTWHYAHETWALPCCVCLHEKNILQSLRGAQKVFFFFHSMSPWGLHTYHPNSSGIASTTTVTWGREDKWFIKWIDERRVGYWFVLFIGASSGVSQRAWLTDNIPSRHSLRRKVAHAKLFGCKYPTHLLFIIGGPDWFWKLFSGQIHP